MVFIVNVNNQTRKVTKKKLQVKHITMRLIVIVVMTSDRMRLKAIG